MKAENFNVGNWVLDNYGNPYRLTKEGLIKALMNNTELTPVKLTDEIILASGFEEDTSTLALGLKEEFHTVIYYSTDHQILIKKNLSNISNEHYVIHIDNSDFMSIGSADVEYVHQAQNLFTVLDMNCEITCPNSVTDAAYLSDFENYCGSCDNFPGDDENSPNYDVRDECPFEGKVCARTRWKELGCKKYMD